MGKHFVDYRLDQLSWFAVQLLYNRAVGSRLEQEVIHAVSNLIARKRILTHIMVSSVKQSRENCLVLKGTN